MTITLPAPMWHLTGTVHNAYANPEQVIIAVNVDQVVSVQIAQLFQQPCELFIGEHVFLLTERDVRAWHIAEHERWDRIGEESLLEDGEDASVAGDVD